VNTIQIKWKKYNLDELIKLLNNLKEFSNLKWFGSSFHVLAAKYLKGSIPYLVVLVDGILAVFWYLKEYLLCLIVIKSWVIWILLKVLHMCCQ
jgi:apolipoprotein N-acyltransferase